MNNQLLYAINILGFHDFGRIWTLREDLLKERVKGYDQKSTRQGHPAVSIRRTPLLSYEAVPMLIGSKKKRRNALPVKIYKDGSDTWLDGTTAPVMLEDFLHQEKSGESILKNFLEVRKVIANPDKGSLSDSEKTNLNDWLTNRTSRRRK